MNATLKEILKPPFRADVYGGTGHIHCGVNKVNYDETRVLDVRGWGFFQNFENGEQLQDEFAEWVVAALNEKWGREQLSCQNAEKLPDGKCVGYQKSETDDEPTDSCMNCKENQFYEDT